MYDNFQAALSVLIPERSLFSLWIFLSFLHILLGKYSRNVVGIGSDFSGCPFIVLSGGKCMLFLFIFKNFF